MMTLREVNIQTFFKNARIMKTANLTAREKVI